MSISVIRKDTYEAFIQNIDSGKIFYIGLTTKGSTTQKINQDKIRAGIGAPVVAVINSQKEVTIEVDTGLHYNGLSEIQNGVEFYTGSTVIPVNVNTTITNNKFTLPGTDIPIDNKVIVEDSTGTQYTGVFSAIDRSVTTMGLVDGLCSAFYQITVANVKELDISPEEFPKNMRLWLHSITYNRKTNKKVEDVYKIYYNVMADGAEDDSGEAGKNSADKIKFEALADEEHNNNMGKIVIIPVQASTNATAPTLTADSTTNNPNTAIDITFTDDTVWRSAITDVIINAVKVPIENVTITTGKITIAGALFPAVGIYNIVVVAKGYNTASLNQTIVSAA